MSKEYEAIIEKDGDKFYLRRKEELGLRHWYSVELREGDSVEISEGQIKVNLPSLKKIISEAIKAGTEI